MGVVAVIAGRSPFLLAAVAVGHWTWTVNDGRQLVDDGDGPRWNWMVDDEGWQSKSDGREE